MKTLIYIGNRLAKHGSNQTSIETLGPALEREGFRIWYASSKKNRIWRMLDMVSTVIVKGKFADFVLIDTYSTQNFWYAWIISWVCRIMRIPFIAKLHGGDLPNRIKRSPKASNQIFKHSVYNIAPSGYLLNAFVSAGYSNVIYIPNTIEIANYPHKFREVLRPRLLWVRSFSSIYNPEMAVHVAGKLKHKYPDTQLCMVGADRENFFPVLEELAKGYALNFRLTGKLAKEEWIDLAKEYDIFINTTHFDNTPVSVIEGMALGLPVVSTNVGGLPYLIEDRKTGILVNDGNVDAMVEGIVRLMEDKELASSISVNARKLVDEFDFEKVKSSWFEILK